MAPRGLCHGCWDEGHAWQRCLHRPKGGILAFLKRGGRGSNGKAQVADEEEQDDKADAVVGEAVAAVGEEQPREGWWIDSGASHNFTPYASDFKSKLQPPEVRGVRLGDGRVVKAVGMGEVPVVGAGGQLLRIQKVHLVPEMHTRLLSVPHLTSRDVIVTFKGKRWVLKRGEKVLAIGEKERGRDHGLNRVTHSALPASITPMEAWSDQKPHVGMARIWGCMGSVMLHGHEKGGKLDACAVMCVCVGVDMESKGWRMLDPSLMRIRIARDVGFLENVMWKDWDKAKGFGELLQDAAEISQLLPLPLSPPSAAVDAAEMPPSSPPPAPLSVSVQQQPTPLQQLSGPSVIQRRSATQATSSSSSSGQRSVPLSTGAPTSPATTSPPPVTGLQVLGIQSGTGGEEVGGDAGVVEGMLCLAREVEGVALAGVSTGDVPHTLAEALRGPEGPAWKAGAEKEVNAMRTMGESTSNGEIGGAGEKKRGQADDAGGKEGGGGGGTWLIDPGDGTSGEGAEFPPAELFTARNFPVRLPRRKGKRRKGDREEDVGGKTNPGTVEGGSVGQDSWVLPVTGDRFPMTPRRPRLGAHRNKLNPKHALPLLPGPPLSPPPLSPSPLSPPPLSPPPLSPPPLSPPPLSPPPLSPPPLSPPLLSPPLLSPPPDTPIRAVGDQRGDHDVAHIEMIGDQRGDHDVVHIAGTTRVWIDHCQVYKALRGTVDAVYGSTDITISNSYISNRNLTMLLGAEDDGVYDVDMRVTLYRNWFDKSGQRQPKARWGRVHVANSLYSKWSYYCLGGPAVHAENVLPVRLKQSGEGVDVVAGVDGWMAGKGWSGGGMDGLLRCLKGLKLSGEGVNGCRDGSWMEGKGWSGGGMDGLLRCLKGLKLSGEGVNGCRDGSWMEGKGWSGGGMDGLLRCLKGLKQSGEGVNGCRDGSWMEGKGWSGGGMDGVMDGERQWNGRLGGEMEAWRDG
ncbi:unnamed protein product [Closterium sp. Naga37s-1]|nr:unnamed protein product [Closterium sp. Naga37s-1]